jgi:hypothetical protein
MVEFLGLIINPTGITMDPEYVEVIWDWATPKTFKEIQIFLGFANFYRRFMKNYSKVVTLLTDLLRGLDQKMNWEPFQLDLTTIEAITKLKACSGMAPILRHYEYNNWTMIETDTSKRAISEILSQLFEE